MKSNEVKYNITIPENIGEITLGQFLKYEELQDLNPEPIIFNLRKLSIFTGIPYKHISCIDSGKYHSLLNKIDAALNTDAKFIDRFTMHDIEFGFVPDLDKISIGEYADMTTYGVEKETLHRLMAVLFRPINKKDGSKYSVMPYDGTEQYAEMMRDMPLNCVNGALVFFYNLANDLQEATLKCLTEELLKETTPLTTSRLSAGIQRLRDWLRTTSLTFQG